MFVAVALASEARPVGVLLGGTGLVRIASRHKPRIAALMKPWSSASEQSGTGYVISTGRR